MKCPETEHMDAVHYEIERKFLIAMPDRGMLESIPGASRSDIVQTYLICGEGESRRVRKSSYGGNCVYTLTSKRHITNIRRVEDEKELSEAEYEKLLSEADPYKRSIIKTRYRIPYEGNLLEIDIYNFWDDWATLEIELESEDALYSIPSWIKVIKEVTEDPRYTNSSLAGMLSGDSMPDMIFFNKTIDKSVRGV